VIPLTRPPARIAEQGTFPLSGLIGARYTIGREAIQDAIPEFMTLSDYYAVDIETAGTDARKKYDVKCVTFSTDDWTLVLDPRDPAQFQVCRRMLNSGKQLVFHRSVFDFPILFATGLADISAIANIWDTLLWARLATPGEHANRGLKNSANDHLGMDLKDPLPAMLKMLGITKSVWYETKDLDTPAYRIMAVSDAILTSRLRPVIRQAAYRQITANHPFSSFGVTGEEAWRLVDREQIINRVTLERTCRGFRVSPEFLDTYQAKTREPQAERVRILTAEGIEPGNGSSLMKWMNARDLIPVDYPRTAKTKQPSSAAKHLAFLDHDIARIFSTHKTSAHDLRYMETAIDSMDADGRIHPEANILAAATGRMSYSGDWPIHQIPEPARGMLLADEGSRLTSIDWAQIESVLMMNIAGEISSPSKVLQRYESGEDLFTTISSQIGQSRKHTKTIVYGSLFGEGNLKLANDLGFITSGELLSIQTLTAEAPEESPLKWADSAAEHLGITGYQEAVNIKTAIFDQMPRTQMLMDKLRGIAKGHRKVFTVSGRILPIPMGKWRGVWGVQTHKGINYYVQGGAYDILAESVIKLVEAGLGDAIQILMHDEIVCSREAAHDVERIMQTPPERLVMLAKRTPVLRTDRADCFGESWTMPCETCGSEPFTVSHPEGKC
jgi:DNA polymerase-1